MTKFIRLPNGALQPLPEPDYPSEQGLPQISPTGAENGVVEQGEGKWQWVGDDRRPEAQESSDGISDLFTVDPEQITDDVEELCDVDFDRDIMDSNENGDLEDLVNVTNEDIIGMAPRPQYRRPAPRRRTNRRNGPPPPTSLGGMRG